MRPATPAAALALALLAALPLAAPAASQPGADDHGQGRIVYLLQAAGTASGEGNRLHHDLVLGALPEPVDFQVSFARYDTGGWVYFVDLSGQAMRAQCAEDSDPPPMGDSATVLPPALDEALRRAGLALARAPGFPGKDVARLVYGYVQYGGPTVASSAGNYQGACGGLQLYGGPSGREMRIRFEGQHWAWAEAAARCPPAAGCGAPAAVPGVGMRFEATMRTFTFYQEWWP